MRAALTFAIALGWAAPVPAADVQAAPPVANRRVAPAGFPLPPFPIGPLPPVAAHAPAPVCDYLGHCLYPPPVDPAALGVSAYVLLPPPPPSPLDVVDYRNDYNQ